MGNEETGSPYHAEPILAVRDVVETVSYWHNTLGFPDKWTWGEPPVHGGVSWQGTFIQFSQNAELANASKGNSVFINVRKLEALYRYHQGKSAEIVEPLENKPWGMAAYTIRDINGYYIVFAGALLSEREREREDNDLSASVSIIKRTPSVREYQHLTASVGWSLYGSDNTVEKLLAAPLFAVVAEDTVTNEVIGCALLIGDHSSFYYVKDVVVHPAWQHRQVGTAMMKQLTGWLENYGADKAFVALITPESLAPFYRQFGFVPAFGMVRYVESTK